MAEARNAADWYAAGGRADRLREAMARNRFAGMLALGPENAAWLSGRTSTIATLHSTQPRHIAIRHRAALTPRQDRSNTFRRGGKRKRQNRLIGPMSSLFGPYRGKVSGRFCRYQN